MHAKPQRCAPGTELNISAARPRAQHLIRTRLIDWTSQRCVDSLLELLLWNRKGLYVLIVDNCDCGRCDSPFDLSGYLSAFQAAGRLDSVKGRRSCRSWNRRGSERLCALNEVTRVFRLASYYPRDSIPFDFESREVKEVTGDHKACPGEYEFYDLVTHCSLLGLITDDLESGARG